MVTVLDIKGMNELDWLDSLLLERTFIAVYNGMCKITNNGVFEAFNGLFEKYFPEEYGANDTYDNAYVKLGCAIEKEIADKLTDIVGKLPSGKRVYLDPDEPITINQDMTVGWFHGYIV